MGDETKNRTGARAAELELVVFAQSPGARLDPDALRAFAARHLSAESLDVRAVAPAAPGDDPGFSIRLVHAVLGTVEVTLETRLATEGDRARASRAEQASGQAGLSKLAERCPRVWIVRGEVSEAPRVWLLAALLTGSLLGPVLDGRDPWIGGYRSAYARFQALL